MTRAWMKSLICRFLVTFIRSTFNISSFCIALYPGTRCLILTGGLVNYRSSGDLTAFFLLFSQIHGLYEAIDKVYEPLKKTSKFQLNWYFRDTLTCSCNLLLLNELRI